MPKIVQQAGSPTAVVLTIAGSDNTAGAGIQADLKTGAAFGVYVATAITAITVQGDGPVQVFPVSADQLRRQIASVLKALPVRAVKIGMLGNTELVRVVADCLKHIHVPVVLDPVLSASAGGSLISGDAQALYVEELLPLVSLLTPNLAEAAALLGEPAADDEAGMIRQAKSLQALGAKAVLIKGGHSQLRLATDYLVQGEHVTPFSSPWLQKEHTHGSGCTLATAIAAGLAQGLSLVQSVAAAKSFIQGAIQHGERLGLVSHNGPVHHFYPYW